MTTKEETFSSRLNDLQTTYDVLMKRFPGTYIAYRNFPEDTEVKNNYTTNISQLKGVFRKMNALENDVMKKSRDLGISLQNQESLYQASLKKYKETVQALQTVLGGDQSAVPREEQIEGSLYSQYFNLGYNLVLIGGLGYIFKKLLSTK